MKGVSRLKCSVRLLHLVNSLLTIHYSNVTGCWSTPVHHCSKVRYKTSRDKNVFSAFSVSYADLVLPLLLLIAID